jgi:hypothetical protein
MIKTKALYGFSPTLGPFAGKAPGRQAALLRSWGNTAIFGGYQNADFVAAAHEAGLRVYAEFGCFVGQQLWDRYPDSRPITAEGSPLEPDGPYWGVNPAIAAVREDRLRALARLLTDYAVDGVWLDFIRWPCHWEVLAPELHQTSFDTETIERFARGAGIGLTAGDTTTVAAVVLDRHAEAWKAWRRDQITSWVKEARRVVDRVRPDALLGLFGVPWRLADYGGAILDIIGQDYRALGRYIDVFSPMVYHAMCGFDLTWIGQVTEEIRELSGKPVWPIIQSVDEPRPVSAEEYGRALEIALDSPASEGVLVYTLEGALDPDKLAATKARFGEASA